MKILSDNFKKAVSEHQPFYAYAVIELADNTQFTVNSQNDFYINGNKYTQAGTDSFPLGQAVCKTIDIGLDNHDNRFSQYDFTGAKITLYTEIDLSNNTVERLQEGIFIATKPTSTDDIIEISANDYMCKTDVPYISTLSYPATIEDMFKEVCRKCTLSYSTSDFPNKAFRVSKKPTNLTCRQVIGYIAQIACGNALINTTGQLLIKPYSREEYRSFDTISGGKLGDGLTDILSGGNIADTIEDTVSAASVNDLDYTLLSDYSEPPTISTDDITITGIKTTKKSGEDVLVGSDDYAVVIENPLIEGKELAALRVMLNDIEGLTIRPFSGNFSPNPALEFMDTVYIIDRKSNIYQSFITEFTFNYLDNCEIANNTQMPEQNNAVYSSNSTIIYRRIEEDLQEDKSAWQEAVDQLNQDLEDSKGLYETIETLEDQSKIYYLHDKPDLADSQTVIKVTAQAIAISVDGGQTYPTGITATGDAIVSILSARGISSDWITSGTLTVGGQNNTKGQIRVLNNDSNISGIWNNNGIALNNSGQFISYGVNSQYRLRIIGTTLQIQVPTGLVLELAPDTIGTAGGAGGRVSAGNSNYIGMGYKNTAGAPAVMAVSTSFSASGNSYDAKTVYIDKAVFKNISKIGTESTFSGNINCGNVTLQIKDGLIIGYS